MKKTMLHMVFCMLAVTSVSAQTFIDGERSISASRVAALPEINKTSNLTSTNKTPYTESFVHEAMELFDWGTIETQLAEELKIPSYKAVEFLGFVFRSGDPSFNTYLHFVQKGDIDKTNAQHFWLKQIPAFKKLYTETYLPYQQQLLSNLRSGQGNNSVMTGGANCNNLDFTNGTAGWTGGWNDQGGVTGSGNYGDITVNSLNSNGYNTTCYVHELCLPGNDPYLPISRVPPGHTSSLRLGNDSAYRMLVNNNGAIGGLPYNHQIISNTFQVTQQNKAVSYWYAVALSQYNPNNHNAFIQPYFRIRMYDQNQNEIVCARYDVDALTAPSIGGFDYVSTQVLSGGSFEEYDLYYKDWSQVMIPLSDYIGQNVTITFETSDCAAGGHFGFAYIAVDCAPLPSITVNPIPCAGGTGTLTGPGGAASYSWAGPGIVSGANSQAAQVNTAGSYTVTMTTLGNSGFSCSFSVDTTIGTPPPGPVADFTYVAVCAGVPTQFTDASTSNGNTISGWHWDFGDGSQSILFNPTHTYAVGFGNTAVVSYTVTTSTGCSSAHTATVNLNQGSAAAFSSNTVCIGGSTQFTNTTPGSGNSYVWSFGDNSTTSATAEPVHVYPSAGTYTASLTVTTAQGCVNTTTHTVSISNPPTASFTHTLPCAGSPVDFTNTSSLLTGSYSWNFGDPSTTTDVSAISNPSYQYGTAGTYTVSLHIDAGNNCIANTTNTISVSPIPTATIAPYASFCPGDQVPDPAISSTPASGVIYTWTNDNPQTGMSSAGNGVPPAFQAAANTSGTNVTGIVSVKPYLNGCPGPPASYTVVIKPTPVIIPPSIQLCPDETSPVINLNSTPASGATTYSWANTTTTTFIGLSVTQGTSTIPSFTTVNTTAFAQSNNIAVSATLNGCPGATVTFPITVFPYPHADFSHTRACTGDQTQFFSQSTINNGTIAQWLWDLDNDGQFDDAASATTAIQLPTAGSHTVSLEVISDKGCKASVSQNIYVNFTPAVDFTGDVLQGCPIHSVTFTANASVPLPEHITGYNWNFGNFTSSDSMGPVTAFYENTSNTDSALYSVTLQVSSDSGCTGSAVKPNYIIVFPKPKADFDWGPKDADIIDPTVYFGNLAIGASGGELPLVWYLGDPSLTNDTDNYSFVQNPVHTYPYVEGDYNVTQYVSNINGCKDTITKTIHINGAFTFYIPNAFTPTPHKDHLNNGFKGTGIGIDNSSYRMLIFDRWGMQIFESHDLEEEWDGTFKGSTVQNDVYVWKVNFLDYLGNDHQYAGTVTLIR